MYSSSSPDSSQHTHRGGSWLKVSLVILIATLLQIGFWMRLGVGGDQSAILGIGKEYVKTGVLEPSIKRTSGDGRVPGVLLTYVVGTMLRMSPDHRVPATLLVLANAISLFVLGLTVKGLVGSHFTFWFLALYGLSPWRLFNGSMLWEPAFLFLPAAVHLAACAALRNRTRLDASFILGVMIAIAFQFHSSFIVLAFATGILVMRKAIRLHWLAISAGGLLGAMPFLLSVFADGGTGPFSFVPHHKTTVIEIMSIAVLNVPKAFLYWLRMGSADVGRRFGETVLPTAVGKLLGVLAIGGILLPLAAAVRSWQELRHRDLSHTKDQNDLLIEREEAFQRAHSVRWLLRYAMALFFSLIASAALSPVRIQSWHSVVAMHAACIAPSLLLSELWAKKHLAARTGVIIFYGIIVAASIALLLWHPLSTG